MSPPLRPIPVQSFVSGFEGSRDQLDSAAPVAYFQAGFRGPDRDSEPDRAVCPGNVLGFYNPLLSTGFPATQGGPALLL